jgi:hypothetical protein
MKSHIVLLGFAIVLLASSSASTADPPGKKVRLFILSGQSNMQGLDPATSFTPAVEKAFPEDDCVVVKSAYSGQLIRTWFKEWKLPEGAEPAGQGKNGRHYEQLLEAVTAAVKNKATPVSVTFCWMQGEADANHKGYGSVYGEALTGLHRQLQEDLKRKDIDVVIGRISDFGNNDPQKRPDWNIIRKAQSDWAEKTPRAAWIDTDDLNGPNNALHYGKENYRTLGQRFASRAVELIKANASRPEQ